ncbi:MAG: hypothetical protein HRT58_06385 [Crocinitomicaceae bacterium]|nr:hypothetical protein [Flavobacteriales bacterium]NQZ35272.1 hypothetical protein [Crocinitomicaceae bacterium]
MKIYSGLMFLLFSFYTQSVIGQNINEEQAKRAVQKYIESTLDKDESYTPVNFHEIFEQPEGKAIAKENSCKGKIVYSVSHSYRINEKEIDFDYFHLNSKYTVICKTSSDDMLNDDLFSVENVTKVMQKLEENEGAPIDSTLSIHTFTPEEFDSPEISFYLNYLSEKDSEGKILEPFVNKGDFIIVFSKKDFLSFLSRRYLENKVMHSSDSRAKIIGVKLYNSLLEDNEERIELSEFYSKLFISDKEFDKIDLQVFRFMIMEMFYHELFFKELFSIENTVDNSKVTSISREDHEVEYVEFIQMKTLFFVINEGGKSKIKEFRSKDYTAK